MDEPRDRSAGRDRRQLKINRTVRRTLSDPQAAGVVVVGGIGAGKSHLLRVLADDLHRAGPRDRQPTVVWSHSGLRRELDPLLGRCRETAITGDHPAAVLLADDLEQWEPPALSALSRGIDSDGLRLFGAVRSPQLPQVLGMLRPSRPLTLIRLTPWRVTDLLRYTTESLGGRLQPMSARRLLDFSAGNAQCLVELLQAGRLSGRLRRRRDVWSWSGPIVVPPITRARIWGELDRSSTDVIDIVITLGSAGRMPVRQLLRLYEPDQLEAADRAGYLRWSADGEMVSGPRLVAQVATIASSPLRRRRLAERLHCVDDGRRGGGQASQRPTLPDSRSDQICPDRTARRAIVDLGRGRITDALRRARSQQEESLPDLINELVIGICLLFSDELDQLRTAAARLCRIGLVRPDAPIYAAGCLLAGVASLAAARPLTALRLFGDGLPALPSEHRWWLLPMIMELQAMGFELAGRPGEAEATHRQARRALESSRPPDSVASTTAGACCGLDGWMDLIRSATLDFRGERPAAYEVAAAACRRARTDGHVLIELLGLRLQQSIHNNEAALSRIAILSAEAQGPLLESLVEHAVATSGHDAGRLAKLAESFERSGMLLLAADTAVSALAADEAELPTPESLGCRQVLRRLAAEPQLVRPEWWRPDQDQPGTPLTHREREIMTAVVGGQTSAEVATRFCLSRRTVENHLQHIYIKLGISSRAELRQVGDPSTGYRQGLPGRCRNRG